LKLKFADSSTGRVNDEFRTARELRDWQPDFAG
jgi:hypothetical protein